MATRTIFVNRAPVLTLWAAVVAERLGFDDNEALSLGRAVAGLTAQLKGRQLGIFKPREARKRAHGEEFWIELIGRLIPVRNTPDGIRAVRGNQIVDPGSVRRYLASKFGKDLGVVRAAMERLAKSYRPEELARQAYALYERFRPEIPAGAKGWGAKGELNLDLIEQLANRSH
jgi:hypothetical protein